MDITAQQARQELARRELARRELSSRQSQDNSATVPKESIATEGLSYVKEHPFKTAFQGAPETITGKTMEQRAIEDVQRPNFSDSIMPKHQEGMPFDAGLDRVKVAAENRVVGGQLSDMATSPMNYIGGPLLRGAGKAIEMTGFVDKLGKPLVAKTMSFFSGVPEKDVIKAIDNPDMLSKDWINKEGIEVKKLYKENIEPAVEKLSNRVDTTGLASRLDQEVKLLNENEATRLSTTMTSPEKARVVKWLNDIKTGDISLNKIDATIGEIDKGLGKVYRKQDLDKAPAVSTSFEALSSKLRGELTELRNSQYPELAPIWNRYSEYKNADRIYNTFNTWQPKLANALKVMGILSPMGLVNPQLFAAGSAMTLPKVQAAMIGAGSGASKIGSAMGKIPMLPIEATKEALGD